MNILVCACLLYHYSVLSYSLYLDMDIEHEIPKKLGVLSAHGDGEPPKTLDVGYVKDIMYYFPPAARRSSKGDCSPGARGTSTC